MEGCLPVLLLVAVIGFIALPFCLWAGLASLRTRVAALEERLSKLAKPPAARETPARQIAPVPALPRPPEAAPRAAPGPAPATPPRQPPPPVGPSPAPAPSAPATPLAEKPERAPHPQPGPTAGLAIEDFLGVKLFAWLGALLAFLGVAFFVKYSFDNNLIRPPVRVAIGGLAGLVTLAAGLRLERPRYRFLVQSLCSAAVLIFYGTLYAAHAYYRLIPQTPTFLLMALVTLAAFFLAVRLDAAAIAVLGLVGGFFTPPLLSTGVDRALALFSYVALLDSGLLALAHRKRWSWLVPLSVAGTCFLQLGWVGQFLVPEKMPVAVGIFTFFPVLFAAALVFVRPAGPQGPLAVAAGLGPAFVSLGFFLLEMAGPRGAALGAPLLLGPALLAVDLAIFVPAAIQSRLRAAVPPAGIAAFAILSVWVERFLAPPTLPFLLGIVLALAVIHGILPVVAERLRPGTAPAAAWSHLFAPVAVLLLLVPLHRLPGPPALVWGAILLLGGAALLTAWRTGRILGFAAMIVLSTLALGVRVGRLPGESLLPGGTVLLIGGFSTIFFLGACVLGASLPNARAQESTLLAALAALLPFAVLILAAGRLTIPDPSPLFGLGAVLAVLAIATAYRTGADGILVATLGGLAVLEFAWHGLRFDPSRATAPCLWYGGFFAAFFALPFALGTWSEKRQLPWTVAAAAGPVQFLLLFLAARRAAPALPRALLALGFAAVYVAGLARRARALPVERRARAPELASLGGVALFFLTSAVPIQLDRQWITVGWALEGVALLWLYRRISHEGLRIASLLLLGTTFLRLLPGVNPFLIEYAPRGPLPILNWLLYTYGIVAACHFAAARLVDPGRPRILDLPARGLFCALGTLLAFLLVNLEIADFFSGDARFLTFRFPPSFAQDMTTSIAWALFAFTLLVIGVAVRSAPARYSGLGLLLITLVKVSLFDLWQLGGLYRVGSLVGLALVLLVVSYLYHRGSPPEARAVPSGPTREGA